MATHVKVLAWFHLILGALGCLVGILIFGFFFFLEFSRSPDAPMFPHYFRVPTALGALFALLALVLSLPAMIAGFGLLRYRNWARILTIVLCILNLLNFPFGSALGAYGLWVLLSRRGEAHYRQRVETL